MCNLCTVCLTGSHLQRQQMRVTLRALPFWENRLSGAEQLCLSWYNFYYINIVFAAKMEQSFADLLSGAFSGKKYVLVMWYFLCLFIHLCKYFLKYLTFKCCCRNSCSVISWWRFGFWEFKFWWKVWGGQNTRKLTNQGRWGFAAGSNCSFV